MPRRRPEIQVFSLSMLDVICSALGAFIILVVLLVQDQNRLEKAVHSANAEAHSARSESLASKAALHNSRAEAAKARGDAEVATEELEAARTARAAAEEETAKAKAEAEAAGKKGVVLRDLDLVFVLDTTGSMASEINDLQRNLVGIVRVLYTLQRSVSVGFVAYRDRGSDEAYLTHEFPLTPMSGGGLDALQAFVDGLQAEGGGDNEEAIEAGFAAARALKWRPNVQRVVIVIGDISCHEPDVAPLNESARAFADEGPRRKVSTIYAAKGRAKTDATVLFFQNLAEAGRGDYVEDEGRILESVLLTVLEPD